MEDFTPIFMGQKLRSREMQKEVSHSPLPQGTQELALAMPSTQ